MPRPLNAVLSFEGGYRVYKAYSCSEWACFWAPYAPVFTFFAQPNSAEMATRERG